MRKGQFVDIDGQRFGSLVALERMPVLQGSRSKWLCQCDCGNKTVVSISNLRNGHTKSCGCAVASASAAAHYKHGGKSKSHPDRLYAVWRAMKQRCQRPSARGYKDYGGRGISVCPEWQSYARFKTWAYSAGYNELAARGQCTIDRIDVNGNYEPANCRWVNMHVQSLNKRNSKHKGENT